MALLKRLDEEKKAANKFASASKKQMSLEDFAAALYELDSKTSTEPPVTNIVMEAFNKGASTVLIERARKLARLLSGYGTNAIFTSLKELADFGLDLSNKHSEQRYGGMGDEADDSPRYKPATKVAKEYGSKILHDEGDEPEDEDDFNEEACGCEDCVPSADDDSQGSDED